MSIVTNQTVVQDVTRISRPGVGPVYRAVVPIIVLYQLLKDSVLRYAPMYQRGFQRKHLDAMTPADYERLLPLSDDQIQVDPKRAQAMAVKYLMGVAGKGKRLFAVDVVWNARKIEGRPEPIFDPVKKTLTIQTVLTVPDSAHRHVGYYLLAFWKEHPENVPKQVDVDGTVVTAEEILDMLDELDLENEAEHSVYAEIFTLDPVAEGWLYDEYNADSKPPSGAVAIDLNKLKTPTRRFIYTLMDHCKIFGRDEVETRSNTIGSKSRKLTTNATLDSAVRPYTKVLAKLEEASGTTSYTDLVEFVCAFYKEWSNHYPEFRPGASADARWDLREASFALSNIMFFPMFRLAFDLWSGYHKNGVDWRDEKGWKDGLAKIAGKVTTSDPVTGNDITVDVMSRENPDWQGKILIRQFNQDGSPKGWSLSSTRQTRDAAYYYLCSVAGIKTEA